MTILVRTAALALALAAAPAAQAAPLCESLKAIMAGMDATPMFLNLSRAENNRPVGRIVPDGWVRCTIGQYEETTGRYTCYGPGGGAPADLAALRAELAKCFGVAGTGSAGYGGQDNELDFVIRRGDPMVTIMTYTEHAGQPDGGIRFSIEYTHPS